MTMCITTSRNNFRAAFIPGVDCAAESFGAGQPGRECAAEAAAGPKATRTTNVRNAFVLTALLLLTAAAGDAAGFKLVVHNDVHMDTLAKKAVSDLFLKRTAKWESGQPVVPVDQIEHTPIREEFSRAVHGKPTAAVKSYWNQQIFSGREVPPVEKQSDADVLKFVRSTPGAIGYVSDGSPTDGVRVIRVE